MSTTVTSTTIISTVLGHSPAQATATPSPPIFEILSILSRTLSTVASFSATSFSFLFQTSKYVTKGALWPISLISSIAAYILSPFFVFFSIAINILLLTPYSVLSNTLYLLYPVYVFCGVAFITAVVIGISGRALIAVLRVVLFHDEQELERVRNLNRRMRAQLLSRGNNLRIDGRE